MKRKNGFLWIVLTILIPGIASLAGDGDFRYEQTRSMSKSISAGPGQTLIVDRTMADISISGGKVDQIQATAEIRVGHDDRKVAETFLKRTSLILEKAGDGHRLRVDSPLDSIRSRRGLSGFLSRLFNNGENRISMSVSLTVRVPEKQNLKIINKFGHIDIDHVNGICRIKNSSGSVILTECGGELDLENSFDRVTVNTFDGPVAIRNSSGKVHINTIRGKTRISNSFNEIRFSDIQGELVIQGQSSEVTGSDLSGNCTINTSFNPVEVSNVRGWLKIKGQSCSVTVSYTHLTLPTN